MVAYVIVMREGPVTDQAEMEEYWRKMPQDPAPFKMTLHSLYGAITPLEKQPADGVVLLEFPSVEDARAWYYSDAYQAAAPHRIKAADYRVMIVDGFVPDL